jgi:hypothetical protein
MEENMNNKIEEIISFDDEVTNQELEDRINSFIFGKYNDGLTSIQIKNKKRSEVKLNTLELPFDD